MRLGHIRDEIANLDSRTSTVPMAILRDASLRDAPQDEGYVKRFW
jgi:hypothetical protein